MAFVNKNLLLRANVKVLWANIMDLKTLNLLNTFWRVINRYIMLLYWLLLGLVVIAKCK